uniref:Uncharacterized protein n=1 Tax=Rhizophora mucronata TaxID=61149 RepID=A0A2P2QUD7_RHIMU
MLDVLHRQDQLSVLVCHLTSCRHTDACHRDHLIHAGDESP